MYSSTGRIGWLTSPPSCTDSTKCTMSTPRSSHSRLSICTLLTISQACWFLPRCPSSFWDRECTASPSSSGRLGRWWWVLKATAAIISHGAPRGYSCSCQTRRSMTTTTARMWVTTAGVSTCGTTSTGQLRSTSSSTASNTIISSNLRQQKGKRAGPIDYLLLIYISVQYI